MSSYRTLTAGILSTGLAFSFGQAVASEPVATVSHIDGVALVSQGPDYVTATPGMALREGDRLMAMEGSSATVAFVDGCVHTLVENAIVTMGPANSCANGTLASVGVGPYLAQVPAAAGAAAGGAGAGAAGVAAGLGGVVGTGAIAAGVVAATVVVGASDAVDTGSSIREDNRPVPSP